MSVRHLFPWVFWAAVLVVTATCLFYWHRNQQLNLAKVDSPNKRKSIASQTFAQKAAQEIRYRDEQDKISFVRYKMSGQDTLGPASKAVKAARERQIQKLFPAIYNSQLIALAFHKDYEHCKMMTAPMFSDTVKSYLTSLDSLLNPRQVVIQMQLVMLMNFVPLDSVNQEMVIKSLADKRQDQLHKVIDRMAEEIKNR